MGYHKEQAEKIQNHGFADTDASICDAHISDHALASRIRSRLSETTCSFCERTGTDDEPIACLFDDFLTIVIGAIRFHYRLAQDEAVPFFDGDWQVPTFDTAEVVEDTLGYGVVDEAVCEAVKESVPFDTWVEKDWQVLNPLQQMKFTWADFTKTVKYQTRFLFMELPKKSEYDPDELSMPEFFKRLLSAFRRTGLVHHPLDFGTPLYRGRTTELPPDTTKYGAKDLGSPPADRASANRMSPAGISMFYGSDSPDTAIAEIAAHTPRKHAVVGTFRTNRNMYIVDLTHLPDVPSVFDEDRREEFWDTLFLREFAEQIAQPVTLDGREHVDYVPTQILTEYLRQQTEMQIDGLQFRSAQGSGTNTVLFLGRDDCGDGSYGDPEGPALMLDPSEIEAFEI